MKNKYNELKTFFNKYTEKFVMDNKEDQENINLKIEHSKRVVKNMEEILVNYDLEEEKYYLAKIIALFHDIGRFKQYEEYNTFSDFKSLDHGKLGVKVIRENNLLNDFNKNFKNIVYKAIEHHNNCNLDKNNFSNDEELFYAKLIRDADKLDIFNIFMEKYLNDNEKNYIINLKHNSKITNEIYNKVLNKEKMKYDKLETVNDLKLMHLSWIYDINFPQTLEIIKKKNYIEIIYNSIKKNKRIEIIHNDVSNYINNKISDS